MSLMKTLAKVAIGVAVAKGASAMMNKNKSTTGSASSGGGLGGLLGGLTGGSTGGSGGNLQDMLGGLMGGSSGASSGGLGGLLNQLGGGGTGTSTSGSSGGLGGLLGGLAGAAGAGGLLSSLGGASQKAPERPEADFGAVLNSQFDSNPAPEITPSRDQEATAALMIAAMIQAAKSDGTFDEAEREKLLNHLGDVDADEADRAAKGEVLGGTISDDMIPLDRLRSQSPPVADGPAAAQGAGAPDQTPSAPAVAERNDDADEMLARPEDAGQDSPEG